MITPDPELQNFPNDFSNEALSSFPVYPLIHTIRRDVEINIDTALNWSQLTSPEINFTVIRPLVVKYARWHNPAIIYVLLVVRSHFQSLAGDDLAYAPIIATRASTCELLTLKLLRHFTGSQLELVAVLTHAWNPLRSAPASVVETVKADLGGDAEDLDDPMNALEVAISTESKKFCSSPLVQNVMNDIWQGHVVFSVASTHALVQDNYKSREIELYDHRNAPFLDHYRLRVPKYRSIVDSVNFVVLLILFVLCLATKHFERFAVAEICFVVFVFGFILDEFAATQEHGWSFYIANMWNGFDLAFIIVFLCYFGLRLKGVHSHDFWYSDLGFDVLACGACVLFPRMAFLPLSNNVVILALRGMIIEFIYFISIAAICFSGLLYTLHNLAGQKWPVKDIAWLMVQIWFGNTYLSFTQARSFHEIFGPILMVVFAALSNTLLITILISILSATFARINENASEEFLFQFTISTLEGVKSDAVLAYQPPFNLAAYAILTALGFVLSPRTLHSVNVFLLRLTAFPMLVAIGCYERWMAPGGQTNRGLELITSGKDKAMSLFRSLPRISIVDAFVGSGSKNLLSAVLRAEAGLDHDDYYPAVTATVDDEAVRAGDSDLATSPTTPTFGSHLKPVPAPLIIGDNACEEDENDYEHELQPRGREGGIQHRRDDSADVEQQHQSRGRYVSVASMHNQQTRQGASPNTPALSLSGQRRNALGLNMGMGMGLASPLARSYAGRGRPRSMMEGGTGGGRNRHDVRANSDDVLAALNRLESTLASVATNVNKRSGTEESGKEGEKGKHAAPSRSASMSVSVGDQETVLKELGERQARIEALLLSLTREMRS